MRCFFRVVESAYQTFYRTTDSTFIVGIENGRTFHCYGIRGVISRVKTLSVDPKVVESVPKQATAILFVGGVTFGAFESQFLKALSETQGIALKVLNTETSSIERDCVAVTAAVRLFRSVFYRPKAIIQPTKSK
jgi:hypothetical protein